MITAQPSVEEAIGFKYYDTREREPRLAKREQVGGVEPTRLSNQASPEARDALYEVLQTTFPASRPEEVNREFDAEQKRDDQNGQHERIHESRASDVSNRMAMSGRGAIGIFRQ